MAAKDIREQVDLIREVFAYTERFRGSTFVIKISNSIIDHPNFAQHARDLALLHKTGIKTVLVPGAKNRIDEVFHKFGVEGRFEKGIRVSDPDSIDLIKMAAFDVAHRLMSALSGHRITAVIGNWVQARSKGVLEGIDFARTGLVDKIRVDAVSRSLEQGHVPIFPCIGHNTIGDPFNLSADDLAATIAKNLNAKKLFFISDDPVMQSPDWIIPDSIEVLEGGRIFRLPHVAVGEILSMNPDKPNRSALESAAGACLAGIDRVHILDGRKNGVLLKEIFSNLGVGTMVFADDGEGLRPMESSDVPKVLEIIRPLVAKGILVDRSREELEIIQKDYWVYTMDGVVHGCAALHRKKENIAEIAGVAVDSQYTELGIGAKIIAHLIDKAANEGIQRVFVLTTRTADWFLAQGFQDASPADLPAEKQIIYNEKRNSRVLIKDLDTSH